MISQIPEVARHLRPARAFDDPPRQVLVGIHDIDLHQVASGRVVHLGIVGVLHDVPGAEPMYDRRAVISFQVVHRESNCALRAVGDDARDGRKVPRHVLVEESLRVGVLRLDDGECEDHNLAVAVEGRRYLENAPSEILDVRA